MSGPRGPSGPRRGGEGRGGDGRGGGAPRTDGPGERVVYGAGPVRDHWLGGLRHIVWDHAKYGNQVRPCATGGACVRPAARA